MAEPLLALRDLKATFDVPGYGVVRAVDGVSLDVAAGEIVGLVGESGCGKSTIGRCITGQVVPAGGRVVLDGMDLGRRRSSEQRRAAQMVFQDPASSLNPRMSVRAVLAELLRVHKLVPRDQVERRCRELMGLVGMPDQALDGHPHQFSGRSAPAHRDRARPGGRAAAAHRRRAGVRARRLGAGDDPAVVRRPAPSSRPRRPAHLAQPRRRPVPLGQGRGDVPRQYRRARGPRHAVQRSPGAVHARAARSRARGSARSARRPIRASRAIRRAP